MIPLIAAILMVLIVGMLLWVLTTSVMHVGLQFAYAGVGEMVPPSALVGKPIQGFKITGQATTANAWSQAHTNALALSNLTGLDPNAMYALRAIYAYSGTGIAIRVDHPSFKGLKPGGLMGTAVGQVKNRTDFEKDYGACPVFSSNSPLILWTYQTGTDTPVLFVEVSRIR